MFQEHAESTIKSYLERGEGAVGGAGAALVVDGRTLTYILDRRSGLVAPFLSLAKRCSAVLCCRATPLQKAYIVKVRVAPLGSYWHSIDTLPLCFVGTSQCMNK